MTMQHVRNILLPIIAGLAFFMILIMACMAMAGLNTRLTPNVPWYPIPVLALVILPTLWVRSRWDIGLTIPPHMPWGKVAAFAVVITIASISVSTLQGAYNDMIRGTETRASDDNLAFLLANAFALSLASAALAEVAFRGIMQTWLQKNFGIWTAILIVALVNTLAHRWDQLTNRWLGLMVGLTALSYLRALTGSMVPPLVTHLVSNILLATGLWLWGPWDLGAMGVPALASFAAAALVALGLAVYLARSIKVERQAPPARETSTPAV